MLELVKYVAEALVEKPEDVRVKLLGGEKTAVIELSVAREDMGKVIGKQGRIAKAIRAVVKAASMKYNKKYVVEIAEHD
ncbi:MAG: KH domain-containing protein [Christensenellales bacterium]